MADVFPPIIKAKISRNSCSSIKSSSLKTGIAHPCQILAALNHTVTNIYGFVKQSIFKIKMADVFPPIINDKISQNSC